MSNVHKFMLPLRRLGRTGLHVTTLSLGGGEFYDLSLVLLHPNLKCPTCNPPQTTPVGIGPSNPDHLYGGVTDDEAQGTSKYH